EALYLVHAELDPAIVAEWSRFHAKEHVPRVVKAAGFLGAQRYQHVGPVDPVHFTTVYRAANLAVVRGYLEGGEVGKMRAHHDAASSAVVAAFRAGPGPALSSEHEKRFGASVTIERAQRASDGRGSPKGDIAIEREIWGEAE